MTVTFRTYHTAHQVQPLTGQILAIHHYIDLAPITMQVARDYPQAARQAMPGQRLLTNDVGELFLAYWSDTTDEEGV